MKTWDESEVNYFLDRTKDEHYFPLFVTALFTGMRRGELLALRWQDLDLLLGQISVCRGLLQLKDNSLIFSEPKSDKSRHTIALTPYNMLVLQSHRDCFRHNKREPVLKETAFEKGTA
jgi:integrase